MLQCQARVNVYVQILKNGRDAKAIVKSSTSARLLSGAGCLQSVATCAKEPSDSLTPPKISNLGSLGARTALPASLIWHRIDDAKPIIRSLATRLQSCQLLTSWSVSLYLVLTRIRGRSHIFMGLGQKSPRSGEAKRHHGPRYFLAPRPTVLGRYTKPPRLSLSLPFCIYDKRASMMVVRLMSLA